MAGELAASHLGGSIPGLPFWDLWWTKCYWDKFFTEYFSARLSMLRVNVSFISCRHCSIVTIDSLMK